MTIENTVKHDELIGGGYVPVVIEIFKLVEGVEVKRGDLIAGEKLDAEFKLATAADTSKYLAIVNETFEGAACSAYTQGVFNRERLTADSEIIDALEIEMKRQGLFLTSIK